ncbi:MAG: protein-tyrosine phosphatase family protein [Gammaproteobacteria bacterium]|nr:protein-tyrosine phosphatase family protein [Gammaproteobacteria bacterium]
MDAIKNMLRGTIHLLFGWFDWRSDPFVGVKTIVARPRLAHVEFSVGNVGAVFIYGGPYPNKPSDIFGVKMAVEIDLPCDVDIPTMDFSTPNVDVMRAGVIKAIDHLLLHRELYVGCMGGIGRTGLFMACLIKEMSRRGLVAGGTEDTDDIVFWIRESYNPYAVETKQQYDYITDF